MEKCLLRVRGMSAAVGRISDDSCKTAARATNEMFEEHFIPSPICAQTAFTFKLPFLQYPITPLEEEINASD